MEAPLEAVTGCTLLSQLSLTASPFSRVVSPSVLINGFTVAEGFGPFIVGFTAQDGFVFLSSSDWFWITLVSLIIGGLQNVTLSYQTGQNIFTRYTLAALHF